MVRSPASLAPLLLVLGALCVLPGDLRAQDAPVVDSEDDHLVERGEFLWNLARRYYDDPFQWRRIYEANQDRIENPDLIYPGQELLIPGVGTVVVESVDVTGVPPADGGDGAGAPADVVDASGARVYPGLGDATVFSDPPRTDIPSPGDRTAFFGALGSRGVQRGGVLASEGVEYYAVSPDDFFSSAWLVDEGREQSAIYPGEVVGWMGVRAQETRQDATIHPFDEIEIRWRGGAAPMEGQVIQMVRVERSEEGFGHVIQPTGLARVVERRDSTVVGVVTDAFRRPRSGDYALPAPRFTLQPGEYAVEGGAARTTRLQGFARDRRVQQLGDIVFLPVGVDDGVSIGDVFAVQGEGGQLGARDVAYRVQVVRTFPDRASARITNVRVPVFDPAASAHRVRRMP